ncbi:MAG: NAD(P)-binding protein [Rhodospirillales bacterium]|nr:NAD(P)-binding protein [Rhodospirillales bacterium]
MSGQRSDMAPLVDLTAEPGTGPVRTRRPVYVDLLPPCNEACPAGENIQAWLAGVTTGRNREAWETLVSDNPLPAVHGRVCYHPCETACNRIKLDGMPVGIHAVERFLGDLAIRVRWPLPPPPTPSGKRVLIVGAGPSGLSAAYHLARHGHAVEIHEAGPLPGGMLHFGIPAYRLPRDVLLAEIRRIEAMGVKIVLGHKVENVLAEQHAGGFHAVFVAIGAHIGRHVEIPAHDAPRMLDALALLRDVAAGEPPKLGRRVVVYGGGNTAMDAARTARRLGAETVIVYRRDRAHMPAHAFEADEALSEGVKIRWLSTIQMIEGETLTLEEMRLDEAGRPQPTGKVETLGADAVVLAVGQDADSRFLAGVPEVEIRPDGTVEVDAQMMTGRPGLFAGGDLVPSERTVTVAVGHGKRAARHIHAWLRGRTVVRPAKHPVVSFEMLHLPLYSDAVPAEEPALAPAARLSGFAEVVSGLDAGEAGREAARCLSCGNCFECDNCFAACPEQAIEKLGPGKFYRIDLALCTGCAVCVEQCPCHAMEMVPEPMTAEGRAP